MKKIVTLIIATCITATLFAQHIETLSLIKKESSKNVSAKFRTASATKQRLDSIVNDNIKAIFTYNKDNYPTQQLTYTYEGKKWKMLYKEDFTYDVKNNIILRGIYYMNGEQITGASKSAYTYDGKGNQATVITSNAEDGINFIPVIKTEYSYNNKDLPVQSLTYSWNGTDWTSFSKADLIYDISSNLISRIIYTGTPAQWYTDSKAEYTYDVSGNELGEQYYEWNGNKWDLSNKRNYTYDLKGNQTSMISYVIDEEGNEIKNSKSEFTYDANNNMTMEAYYTMEQSDEWTGTDRYDYTLDLSVSANDLALPYFFEGDFTNKVTKEIEYLSFDNGQWADPSEGVYYYSEIIATSNIGKTTNNLNELNVYPNPASGYVSFNNSSASNTLLMELYDVQGRKAYSAQIENNKPVSIQNVQQGIYFYRITNEDAAVYNGTLILE